MTDVYYSGGQAVGAGSTGVAASGNVQLIPLPHVTGDVSLINLSDTFSAAQQVAQIAQQSIDKAQDYIAEMGTLAAALVPPSITPNFPQNTNAPAISSPIAPDLAPIVFVMPPVPAPFTDRLDPNTDFPAFDNTPPQLTFPNAPAAPAYNAPAAPGIDTNFTYPTVDVKLPTPPALLQIDVARFDGVTFPTLSATAPTLTLAEPRTYPFIAGLPYTDALLDRLKAVCQARLDMGVTGTNTGLPSIVETNIWNASREKEWRARADAIISLDRMESMGYALPPGTFVDARIKIETEAQATFAGSARDIAIAQAKLEQDNIGKAMDISRDIESKLIEYSNQREQRTFDAAKYMTEAGISIYNADVQAFTARIQGYRAAIEVYTAQMEGAKTQVAVYTAEIEAEKLKASINTDLIQQYKVSVDAALASIEVFKGEIQIVQTRASIEQLKINIFGEQVRAYAAEINVYSSQVEAYKSAIQAEQTKEQAYATSAQAYGTLVQATTAQVTAKIDVYKAELAAKAEEYDAFKAQVAGQAEQVRAVAAQNSAVADIYRATVSGTSSYNDAMIKEWQAQIQLAESVTQIGVSAAQANGQLYLTAKSVLTDAAKVGAQVEAQIAASALGAVTYATHQSRQDSVSVGNNSSASTSNSGSNSISAADNTSKTDATSTSTTTNTSTTTSTSSNTNINISEAQ